MVWIVGEREGGMKGRQCVRRMRRVGRGIDVVGEIRRKIVGVEGVSSASLLSGLTALVCASAAEALFVGRAERPAAALLSMPGF